VTWELRLLHHFDAAHHLPGYDGACANLHGHRWEVQVEIDSDTLNDQGMVADFKMIKRVIDRLDHSYLNEHDGLDNPTAEIVAQYLKRAIARETGLAVKGVTVWESPGAEITFR
jgi:6-pyruvoyltetrahydropterin/6-carboxytetrahydropterin synthase